MKFRFVDLEYELNNNLLYLSPFLMALEPEEEKIIEIPEKFMIEELKIFNKWLEIIEYIYNLNDSEKILSGFEKYYRQFIRNGVFKDDKFQNLINFFVLNDIQKKLQHDYFKFLMKMVLNNEEWISGRNW